METNGNFKPIHRFFHGDGIDGVPNMYSMSIGDTWLYFNDNRLVGVLKLVIENDQRDQFYILGSAAPYAKKAMIDEMQNVDTTYVDIDELVGHALRLVSSEISELIQSRLIPNQGE
jgi:hypothetical protein